MSAIHKIGKSKNRADVKAITKKPNKTSGTSFDEGYIDESFQKLELKIYELNKSVNYELALMNKKMDSFPECLNKLVKSSLTGQREKSIEENISLLKKNLCTKD